MRRSIFHSNRYGHFRITKIFAEVAPGQAMKIMKRVFITKAEYNFPENCFEYWGYCNLFDEVPKGQKCGEYIFVIIDKNKLSVEKLGA